MYIKTECTNTIQMACKEGTQAENVATELKEVNLNSSLDRNVSGSLFVRWYISDCPAL